MEGGDKGEAMQDLASSKLPTEQDSEKCDETSEKLEPAAGGTGLVHKFEAFFYRLGSLSASRPVPVILACLVLTCLGCAGLPFIQIENDAIKLWIPQNSDFSVNYDWLWNNFPPDIRQHSIILHSDDVLTPASIQKMYQIYKAVYAINTEQNKTWEDCCLRVPGPPSRHAPLPVSRLLALRTLANYSLTYCDQVSVLPTRCLQSSLLELWAVEGGLGEESELAISRLDKKDILDKINGLAYSKFYMLEKDFISLLGGVERDDDGQVVSARAATMRWTGRMDAERALREGGRDNAGTGGLVDADTDMFERQLTQVLLNSRESEPLSLRIEVNVANSFGDIASSTIWGDVDYLILGFGIVFVYVNLMLGKFNMVEQRGYLSLLGLASVAMAIAFSYGFCSLCGLTYGPLHNIIPFLLLGIGIDDMFVTMQCFNNLREEDSRRPLAHRFGLTMSRAGCAITVTSLTDFLAFAIGGTTVLPALRSFCIYCAVGLLAVYLLQATWFVAWFSLDQRRVEAGRNGSLICYTHKDFKPNTFSQKNLLQNVFKLLAKAVVTLPVKVAIISISTVLFAISIWGNVLLRQEFNPIWFLPPESYLAQWHLHNSLNFPSQGEQVTVFMAGLHLPQELDKLDMVHSQLRQQEDIIDPDSLDSWYIDFKTYVNKNFEAGLPEQEMQSEEFESRMTQFLFSPSGSKHRLLVNFNSSLTCGQPAPELELATLTFSHNLMSGPKQQIPAMNRVKEILSSANFSSKVFPMCKGYASWETDEVISEELYRNILLAILCVFLTTWALLFNIWASLQVLGCVILTLVNVGGFIHFWGLTIDTVSCTNIIIAIGLCVDYSAHIAHAFMSSTGSREERVKTALADIGPAVLNGGFSTFLAFVLLAGSKSHVFATFFKVFFLVVLFGLFNGLLLLPVVLSFIGPASYGEVKQVKEEEEREETETLKPIVKNGSTPSAQ